jgi:hypothetical protein
MELANINLQALMDPDNPLDPTQMAMLWHLCEAEENGGRVPRGTLYVATGLIDPDPVVNNYGFRRILGSITQRLNTSAWYRSERDATVAGGRWYLLREDLRDPVRNLLTLMTA